MKFPDHFRFTGPGHPFHSDPGQPFGMFIIPPVRIGKTGRTRTMKVIACAADPAQGVQWDHVSVTLGRGSDGLRDSTPTWVEMCCIKDLFWDAEETVVQYHPAASSYVNHHPGCLHLWRFAGGEFPTPPIELV